LPKHIGLSLDARQEAQQKAPDDEHQGQLDQTFQNHHGQQHKDPKISEWNFNAWHFVQ
jgi:hypothetical protein